MIKTVSVPEVLIKATKEPTVAKKLAVLDTIAGHPLTKHLVDGITILVDRCMKDNISQEEMLRLINNFLKGAADKFSK